MVNNCHGLDVWRTKTHVLPCQPLSNANNWYAILSHCWFLPLWFSIIITYHPVVGPDGRRRVKERRGGVAWAGEGGACRLSTSWCELTLLLLQLFYPLIDKVAVTFQFVKGEKMKRANFPSAWPFAMCHVSLFFTLLARTNATLDVENAKSWISAFCPVMLMIRTVIRFCIYSSCLIPVLWITSFICHNLTWHLI